MDPCPPLARSRDKAYQISGCTVARKKIQMLRKKVKLLLEQLQVCIFAKTVFGVRCTLSGTLVVSQRPDLFLNRAKTRVYETR